MARVRMVTVANRISYVSKGDRMGSIGVSGSMSGAPVTVQFVIEDYAARYVQVELSAAELDSLVEARDRFRARLAEEAL